MRKFKRLLAAVLTAALAASLAVLPAGAAGSFSDIGDQTTAVNADILRLMGVVSGVGGDRFEPNGVVTRAMVVTVLANLSGVKGEEASEQHFLDVPLDRWYASSVEWAARYAIVSGVGGFLFQPNAPATREQSASAAVPLKSRVKKAATKAKPAS